jgi:hypothetical protein
MELTLQELMDLWNKYNRDSQLRSELRFGQWICNRKLKPGWTWASCYYADNQAAYGLLLDFIEGRGAPTLKKVY